jgi:hypothetical protein
LGAVVNFGLLVFWGQAHKAGRADVFGKVWIQEVATSRVEIVDVDPDTGRLVVRYVLGPEGLKRDTLNRSPILGSR